MNETKFSKPTMALTENGVTVFEASLNTVLLRSVSHLKNSLDSLGTN